MLVYEVLWNFEKLLTLGYKKCIKLVSFISAVKLILRYNELTKRYTTVAKSSKTCKNIINIPILINDANVFYY